MRIGVDTGGTFTDVVAAPGDGSLRLFKLASRGAAAQVALDGVRGASGATGAAEVIHATTLATNALLERSGGPTALLTTAGFEDVLALGRHHRPRLYALHPVVPPPLVPRALCVGVVERLGAGGEVVLPLDLAALDPVVAALEVLIGQGAVRSIAVSLLHSCTNPEHERRVAERLHGLGVPLSLSSLVLPELGEFERTSTTAVDAYVKPVMSAWLGTLAGELASLRVMRSCGGAASSSIVARSPVGSVLSGPAAGVIGAHAVSAALGMGRLVTLDVGGTSTDVALVDGAPEPDADPQATFEIDGVCVRQPSLRVHVVGVGGGSIAWRDGGGALKVGPRSAGAQPGPACYGLGGALPTVTDAALLLGRIPGPLGDAFLDGGMPLDAAAAERAMAPLAAALGLSIADTCDGVMRVLVAQVARAVVVVSVARGHHPRELTLVAFGGAGGLLACDVAGALDMPRVFLPPAPGLLGAYGALVAEVTCDHVAARVQPVPERLTAGALAPELLPLESAAAAALAAEGVPVSLRLLDRRCDLRYRGQSHPLSVLLPTGEPTFDVTAAFHAQHAHRHGFADHGRALERVALRVRGRGLPPAAAAPPLFTSLEGGDPLLGHRAGAAILVRSRLLPGARVEGPAALVEYSATSFIPAGWAGVVHPGGGLVLSRR